MSVKHLELYLNELAWRISNWDQNLLELTLRRLLSSRHMPYGKTVVWSCLCFGTDLAPCKTCARRVYCH